MNSLKAALNMIPPGADLIGLGALLALGTKVKTVQYVAFGLGAAMLFLSMQAKTPA